MKIKILLLMCCTVAFGCSVQAQSSRSMGNQFKETVKHRVQNSEHGIIPQATVAPVISKTMSRRGTVKRTNSACLADVVWTGSAPNALTCANNSRSNISYNKDLNAVVFIHRANVGTPAAAKTNGYYVMDVSTDGGANWVSDIGPIYSDPVPLADQLGTYRGRYPLCDIYNPSGNTDLAQAYLAYSGPYTSVVAPPSWRGLVWGAANLSTASSTSNVTVIDAEASFMENMFVTKNGTAWRVGQDYWSASDDYKSTIHLAKGTFNSSTSEFDYVTIHPAIPCDTTNLGGLLDLDIVFADDNLTGYIAVINNNDYPNYTCTQDTTIYISIYKTTDGGVTWGPNFDLDLQHVFDADLANDGSTYACGPDFDLVVDKDKNLHIVTSIHPSSGYAFSFAPGVFAMYDIYTTDMGTTWKAQFLDYPGTYRGVFGPDGAQASFNEYARPFASRSDDGSKLFFGWFDTDTSIFGGVGNTYPNLHMKGYDVTADLWTPAMDLTSGSGADAICTFGNGAYYVIEDGSGTYTIPVFIQALLTNPTTISHATSMGYVSGLCVNGSDFTKTENPLTVPQLTCTPVSMLVGIDDLNGSANRLMVSGNYPNPFTGTTIVDVSLPKPGDATVEISAVTGQSLFSKTYKHLRAGKNSLVIDGHDLAAGIYIYKVKFGTEMVANTMIVK